MEFEICFSGVLVLCNSSFNPLIYESAFNLFWFQDQSANSRYRAPQASQPRLRQTQSDPSEARSRQFTHQWASDRRDWTAPHRDPECRPTPAACPATTRPCSKTGRRRRECCHSGSGPAPIRRRWRTRRSTRCVGRVRCRRRRRTCRCRPTSTCRRCIGSSAASFWGDICSRFVHFVLLMKGPIKVTTLSVIMELSGEFKLKTINDGLTFPT